MGVDIETYRAKIGTYRNSYGVDVVTLVCVVNFSKGLKTVGCVLFIGILLIIAGVEQNPGPGKYVSVPGEARYLDDAQFYSDAVQSDEENYKTKLRMTELPKEATAEILTTCLERMIRGGKIIKIMVDDQDNSAIVEFEDTSAVDKVTQNLPIIILGTQINVELYDENTQAKSIEVTGSLKGVRDEALIKCLQNEKGKGTLDLPSKKVTTAHDKHQVVDAFEDIAGSAQSTKIRVTGLPKGATDEFLTNFFENENRLKGVKVKEIIPVDAGYSTIVEFEDASAVYNVMQKQPMFMLGTQVNIEVFDKHTRPTKIEVTGLPKRVTEEDLTKYFENEKWIGTPVKSVKVDNAKHFAVVEFEDSSAVELVMQKQPIVIRGKEVTIQVVSSEDYHSRLSKRKRHGFHLWKKLKYKMMALRSFATKNKKAAHQTPDGCVRTCNKNPICYNVTNCFAL